MDRDEIDQLLVSGTPYRVISERNGVSTSALSRHMNRHVSPAVQQVAADREVERSASLLDRVEGLVGRVERLIDDAESAGKPGQMLSAVAEARRLLELLGKVSGELRDGPQHLAVNIFTVPEWLQAKAVLNEVLDPYPEVRYELATRLQALEAGS